MISKVVSFIAYKITTKDFKDFILNTKKFNFKKLNIIIYKNNKVLEIVFDFFYLINITINQVQITSFETNI